MTKRRPTSSTDPPLVDASMRNLYRDETFWVFHYPNPVQRAQAMAAYETYGRDDAALRNLISQMPDRRPPDEDETEQEISPTPDTETPGASWMGRVIRSFTRGNTHTEQALISKDSNVAR